MTTPDYADLRERIEAACARVEADECRTESSTSFVDAVMAVVTPELERRDAEYAQAVEDWGRNSEQELADSARLAAELDEKTRDWRALLEECCAVRQALIDGGHGLHGTEDAAPAVATLIAQLRDAEARPPAGLAWHATHTPPGTTDAEDTDAPVPAGWWVTGHDPEQPDGPVVQMLVESTPFRLVEENQAGEWAERIAHALNGLDLPKMEVAADRPRQQCDWWWDTKRCPDWAERDRALCTVHRRERERYDAETERICAAPPAAADTTPRVWALGDQEPPADVPALRQSSGSYWRYLIRGAKSGWYFSNELAPKRPVTEGSGWGWAISRAELPLTQVTQVADCHGDVWTWDAETGEWTSPDTQNCAWTYMARKWKPLVEVLPTTEQEAEK